MIKLKRISFNKAYCYNCCCYFWKTNTICIIRKILMLSLSHFSITYQNSVWNYWGEMYMCCYLILQPTAVNCSRCQITKVDLKCIYIHKQCPRLILFTHICLFTNSFLLSLYMLNETLLNNQPHAMRKMCILHDCSIVFCA